MTQLYELSHYIVLLCHWILSKCLRSLPQTDPSVPPLTLCAALYPAEATRRNSKSEDIPSPVSYTEVIQGLSSAH
jgi:hypothetical protein